MTFKELYWAAREPGRKVFAVTQITQDDVLMVEVKKMDFVRRIAAICNGGQGNLETNAWLDSDNNVVVN